VGTTIVILFRVRRGLSRSLRVLPTLHFGGFFHLHLFSPANRKLDFIFDQVVVYCTLKKCKTTVVCLYPELECEALGVCVS
jgi:hypothetical protein